MCSAIYPGAYDAYTHIQTTHIRTMPTLCVHTARLSMCVYVWVCVCVCMCVWERVREREREKVREIHMHHQQVGWLAVCVSTTSLWSIMSQSKHWFRHKSPSKKHLYRIPKAPIHQRYHGTLKVPRTQTSARTLKAPRRARHPCKDTNTKGTKDTNSYRGLQVGWGTRVRVDNHNLHIIEFLDYRNVQCCGQLLCLLE